MMKMRFIGSKFGVTGSMTLLENDKGKILIDCGLYQGTDEVVRQNLNPLSFDPKEIKAIILTHAHLDHSGFLPRLARLGFRGQIIATKPTLKLAMIILNDSAEIQEKETEHLLNDFYDKSDVIMCTSFFKPKPYNEEFEVLGLKIYLQPAGHILGAASVVIQGEKKIVFSGDLGRFDDILIKPPALCPDADSIVMESTYGGKNREGNIQQELLSFVHKIKEGKKIGIIASFAVARAQLLITLLTQHFLHHPEDKVRLVIDGPMMSEANKIYTQYADETLIPDELKKSLAHVEIIDRLYEWEIIRKLEGPMIVISSSGMVTGGRIWRYLENWQDNEEAMLFLPGYQAEGTPGRALAEGQKTVRINEHKINWRGEVLFSSAFSSHADQNDLIHWLQNVRKDAHIYLNHGEKDSKTKLKEKLETLGFSKISVAGIDV